MKMTFFLKKQCQTVKVGGHGGLRYCGISVILILNWGIKALFSPVVCSFSPFWLTVFGKRRSFIVLRYFSMNSPV